MFNHVSFEYSKCVVALSEMTDILSVESARWLLILLRKIPEIQIDENLCQEDWGVVFFAKREGKTFWIGMSWWPSENDRDYEWLVHFHHGSFAWIQRFTSSGQNSLKNLVKDFHTVLINDPDISKVKWYEEKDMIKPVPKSFPEPD